MKGSGSFWMTIIWNKRNKFYERTEARVGSNPPPHQPPFAYFWSITCFCTKKRNAFRCTCLRCYFCFKTIQDKQAKFFFTLTFSYRKDQNNVTSTKSLKYPKPPYSQESQVSTESPLSSINNINKHLQIHQNHQVYQKHPDVPELRD